MTKELEKIVDEIGGSEDIRKFEDYWTPAQFVADIRLRLKIPKHYASYLAKLYEEHVYKKVLEEYKRISDDKTD